MDKRAYVMELFGVRIGCSKDEWLEHIQNVLDHNLPYKIVQYPHNSTCLILPIKSKAIGE